MRSLNLRRLTSFLTFDLPVNYHHLYYCFRQTHEGQRITYASWPAAATRRRLICDYWSNALLHYLLVFGLSATFALLYNGLGGGMNVAV